MDVPAVRYSFQCYQLVAIRRGREARRLLEADRRHCDGAVACALLAAECALKATIIFGHDVMYEDLLPDTIQKQVFRGARTHDLVQLFGKQPQTARRAPLPLDQITRLSRRDRYRHRYGHLSPPRHEASAVLADSAVVVQWMKGVIP